MPNIFTDCSEQEINAKLSALNQCQAMLTARMRYFYAKLDFIAHGNTMEELRDLYVDLMFVNLCSKEEIEESIKSSDVMRRLTLELQFNLAGVLAVHKKILVLIENLIDGKEPDGLRLCAELAIRMAEQEQEYAKARQAQSFHIERLQESLRVAQRSNNKKEADRLRAEIKSARTQFEKAIKALKKFDGSVLNSKIFAEIYSILDGVVFGKMESDFKNEYIEIKIVEHINDVGDLESDLHVSLTQSFRRLHERNKQYLQEVKKRCIARHNKIRSSINFDAVTKELSDGMQSLIGPINTTADDYIRSFRLAYNFRKELTALDAADAAIVEAELRWIAEQEKIAAAQQAEAQRKLQEAARAEAAKMAEEAERIKKELAEQAAKEEQEKKLNAQAHAEQLARDKAAKEAAKVQLEVARRRRHLQQVKALQTTRSDAEGKKIIVSNIKIPTDLFLANIELIHALFAFNTKRFAYSDAKRLIIALGGELKEDTKSSHKTIIFNMIAYQEFDVLQQDQETVGSPRAEGKSPTLKATLVEPHGSKVDCVTAYNLDLLRDAISSILPENWQAELDKRFVDPVHTKWSAKLGLAA